MPIRIKAIEKKMNVGIHKDTYRYQMQPELYSTLCSRSFAFCNKGEVFRSPAARPIVSVRTSC